MFDLDAVSWSSTARGGQGQLLGEVVATLGLILVIFLLVNSGQIRQIGPAVGLYIGAAYFFTSSTSFANPAVTLGRQFSDTFAGIEPASVPFFIVMQVIGAVLAIGLIRWLSAEPTPQA